MFMMANSLKQMLRMPGRIALFLALLALASALLMLGANLFMAVEQNRKMFEQTFHTIGTAQQQVDAIEISTVWDAYDRDYSYLKHNTYSEKLPTSVLEFEGAEYIYPPERRPYYAAYHPELKTDDASYYDQWISFNTLIVEVEALESGVADHSLRVKITRVLAGDPDFNEELWVCDHLNDTPGTLEAGKRYVMALQVGVWAHSVTEKFEEEKEYWIIWDFASSQFTSGGQLVPSRIDGGIPWDEVTPGFYNTPRGKSWESLGKVLNEVFYTFPVIPTNATHLLMSFYGNNANIEEGRDISKEEYASGKRVCMISNDFAKRNGLEVGDRLKLPLYYADYKSSPGNAYEDDGQVGMVFAILNAQEEPYQPFWDEEYKIVGIYHQLGSFGGSDYELGKNAVIIPAASVQNSDENNIVNFGPMMGYSTSFEIPNGDIERYVEEWNKQGISNLEIQFYDKGYTQLKAGLDLMRNVALALLTVGIAATVLILLFFTYLFISKQKKRTAIERSLGVSKKHCMVSLMGGMLLLAAVGGFAGCMAGYLATGSVMQAVAQSMSGQMFSTQFSMWVNSADQAAETALNMALAEPGVILLIGAFVFLAAAVIAYGGARRNLKEEPLSMLSGREE